MKLDRKHMLLYAVTDRTWLNGQSLSLQVEQALKGGVTCIQLREKELSHNEFLNEALEIKQLCKNYNVPFIINDDVEIAVKCSADGIHVGQSDMDAYDVRSKIGSDMILGVSVHSVSEALTAQEKGADYLGVGAMFSTSTKLDANDVSFETLSDICKSVSIPVVAIGGIQKHNIKELSGTGIDGVALISAIFASEDIENECQTLKKLTEETVSFKK